MRANGRALRARRTFALAALHLLAHVRVHFLERYVADALLGHWPSSAGAFRTSMRRRFAACYRKITIRVSVNDDGQRRTGTATNLAGALRCGICTSCRSSRAGAAWRRPLSHLSTSQSVVSDGDRQPRSARSAFACSNAAPRASSQPIYANDAAQAQPTSPSTSCTQASRISRRLADAAPARCAWPAPSSCRRLHLGCGRWIFRSPPEDRLPGDRRRLQTSANSANCRSAAST